MATKTLADEIRESMAQVVVCVDSEPVTRGRLDAAFKRVQPTNWKDPIDALVYGVDAHELAVITSAIEFFTGSKSEVTSVAGGYRIKAAGYYATVGA